MTAASRFGTGLLLAGGVALALLMVYTLAWVGGPSHYGPAAPADAAEVAVFVRERADWLDFRVAVAHAAHRGLVRTVAEADDAVIVATPRHGRTIRFDWRPVRGVDETKSEVRRLTAGPRPPVALVGADNTYWTVVLAEALRDASPRGSGPVLLVPWATSDQVQPTQGPPGLVPLLDILAGRTFRFCPSNRREAELVVRCLVNREPQAPPARAVLVSDSADPYSIDLASGFEAALRRVLPRLEITHDRGALSFPSMGDRPDEADARWAEGVWREARAHTARGPTWVVLPLQGDPARRLIAALRSRATMETGPVPVRVLCGDGVGQETLAEFAGSTPFAIWSVSSASVDGPDLQVLAEIVAALAVGLDRPESTGADALRDALSNLKVEASEPAAVAGRPLAFLPSGERSGEGLGHVLATRPGEAEVIAYVPGPGNHWRETKTTVPAAIEARR